MSPTGISGDRELVAALMQLANGLTVVDIDQSAALAMEPMAETTRKNFRRYRQDASNRYFPDWGRKTKNGKHIDQNIVVRRVKGGSKSKRSYRLAAKGPAIKKAHLVEFGTAPHWQPKRKMFHPGARAQPSMTPAYEQHKAGVERRMAEELWERLEARILTIQKKGPRRRR